MSFLIKNGTIKKKNNKSLVNPIKSRIFVKQIHIYKYK